MSTEKIAIIGGTGHLGFGLALRWASAGLHVSIGSREKEKADEAVERLKVQLPTSVATRVNIDGFRNAEAAGQASVVILTVPFPAQAPTLKEIRGSLKDCILVDATVPLAATVGGKPTRMLGLWQGSAAEQAREMIPAEIPVLAAFHSLSAEVLQDLSKTPDCDILVCGDDPGAKERLFQLIRLIPGVRPLDAGSLEMARIVESLTALLVSLNRYYHVHDSGIRITGLPSQL